VAEVARLLEGHLAHLQQPARVPQPPPVPAAKKRPGGRFWTPDREYFPEGSLRWRLLPKDLHVLFWLAVVGGAVFLAFCLLPSALLLGRFFAVEGPERNLSAIETPVPGPPDVVPPVAAQPDWERLQGTWFRVAIAHGGKRFGENRDDTITYDGHRFAVKEHGEVTLAGTFEINEAEKHMDLICTEGRYKGKRLRSIYRIDGDRLETCTDDGTDNRPKLFSDDAGFYRDMKRKKL
jgi:uncharacterized protein (TIGR03067 family)